MVNKKSTSEVLTPIVAILNCKAGVLRESFLTRFRLLGSRNVSLRFSIYSDASTFNYMALPVLANVNLTFVSL